MEAAAAVGVAGVFVLATTWLICRTVTVVRERKTNDEHFEVLASIGRNLEQIAADRAADAAASLPEAPLLNGRTVVIHTTSNEQTVRGVVANEYVDQVWLERATYLEASGGGLPAKGLVRIDRDKIVSTQVIEEE